MIVQLDGGCALRLAGVGVLGEVGGQRREADREIIAVAQAHAHGTERCVLRRAKPARARAAFAVLPDRAARHRAAAIAARILLIGSTAIVARQFAHDIVPIGATARAQDLLALGLQIAQTPLGRLDLSRQIVALLGRAQGLGEQKIIVAVGSFEAALALLVGLIGRAHLGFDLGQCVARLCAFLVFQHEALLELGAHWVAREPLAALRSSPRRDRSWGWNGGGRRPIDGLARTRRGLVPWPSEALGVHGCRQDHNHEPASSQRNQCAGKLTPGSAGFKRHGVCNSSGAGADAYPDSVIG